MTRRVERAEPVGEPSQPAAEKSTPMTITVVAMLVISEVAIDQVASAAGLALCALTSWSTTMPPAMWRATITANPAAIRPMPAKSTATQRLSRAR